MQLRTLIATSALAAALLAGAALAAASAAPTRPGTACGVERWAVKTLTDPEAGNVDFTPRQHTVDYLRSRPRPAHLGARVPPVETTTYRVKATLVEMKLEPDSDIHLVIAQPGKPSHTMIVEFPAYGCTKGALKRTAMRNARAALRAACGPAPDSEFVALEGSGQRLAHALLASLLRGGRRFQRVCCLSDGGHDLDLGQTRWGHRRA